VTEARLCDRWILAVSAVLFATLAVSALIVPPPAIEVALREQLLRLDAGMGAEIMRWIDHAGTWRVILPGTALLFAASRQARARWWVWAVALLAAPAAETALRTSPWAFPAAMPRRRRPSSAP
jgi:hypothetical protein